MLFDIEHRPLDSPFVERIWRAQGERAGDFLSVAATHWELVVSRYRDETIVTVRGPETKVTPMHVTSVGAEHTKKKPTIFANSPALAPGASVARFAVNFPVETDFKKALSVEVDADFYK